MDSGISMSFPGVGALSIVSDRITMNRDGWYLWTLGRACRGWDLLMGLAPIRRRWWPIAVAALLEGCGFDPRPTSGTVACVPQGKACCPEGYLCVGRGAATAAGPAAGTCWSTQDLPPSALGAVHDHSPAIPNDPGCLVTDWLPPKPGTGGTSGTIDGGVDVAWWPPTGTGGAGGSFPDARLGEDVPPDVGPSPPEVGGSADAPVAERDAARDSAVDVGLPGHLDGAADAPTAQDADGGPIDRGTDRPPPPSDGVPDQPISFEVGAEASVKVDTSPDRSTAGDVGAVDSGTSRTITSITAGWAHTCAVVDGDVLCWGDNSYGQLGNNTTTSTTHPSPVIGLPSGAATAVATAYGHTCAVVNGGAKCWGHNVKGQLGNNSNFSSLLPVSVVGLESGVTAISAGRNVTCAVANGGAQCWGENVDYQLGDGTQTDRWTPVQVSGLASGASAIATEGAYGCAVVNGGLLCWGGNSSGQLGDNTTVLRKTPVQVLGLEAGVTAVAAGSSTTCAVVNRGVHCWGDGSDGQLGNGTTTGSKAPVQVLGTIDNVTAVSVSTGLIRVFVCATAGGGVRCWGNNFEYQLGNGSDVDSTTPVSALGVTGATLLAVGDAHACTVVGATLKCWGANDAGQASGGPGGGYVQRPSAVALP